MSCDAMIAILDFETTEKEDWFSGPSIYVYHLKFNLKKEFLRKTLTNQVLMSERSVYYVMMKSLCLDGQFIILQ
jgi:hypothetical protein